MPAASVGTAAVILVSKADGFLLDFIIQNLSVNNVYFLQSTSEGTSSGLQIVAGAWMAGQDYDKDLIVIADGAASDVRYIYVRKANITGVGSVTVAVATSRGVDP